MTKAFARRKFLYVALAFAFFAVIQPQVVNAKDPVTRPLKITSQYTILDFLAGLPWTFFEDGIASQFGHFNSVGKYVEADGGFYGVGILFTANGDQIFWEQPGGNVIKFTGGTGMFQGATGEITYTVTSTNFVAGPSGTTSLISTYTAVGTITY